MYGSPFSYLFCDLVTGDVIEELPVTGVSFGEVLNGIGQFQGNVPIQSAAVRALDWDTATQPGRTFLVVTYEGTVAWSGIIWQTTYTSDTQGLPIMASTDWSYWAHRLQQVGHKNTWASAPGGDPMQIAKTMIVEAQASAVREGAQILGTASNTPPGIPVVIEGGPTPGRDWIVQSYPLSQLQYIDSIVTSLSQLGYGQGFDYKMRTQWVDGVLAPVITLAYPRLGIVGAASPIVFDTSDAESWSYPVDATGAAPVWIATGSGSGGVQAVAIDAAMLVEGWPRYEGTISSTTLSDLTGLTGIANGQLNANAFPTIVPTIVTFVDADPVLGSFDVGDDCLFSVPLLPDNLPTSPRFPDGLNVALRVTEWTVSVPDAGGRATIATAFATPPASSPVQPPT